MIMIDLETLDTAHTAKILSIGVVRFCHVDYIVTDQLYLKLDPTLQTTRTESPDTLLWWSKQPEQVRTSTFGGTLSLEEAITELNHFFNGRSHEKFWSKGSFDFNIMENVYNQLNQPYPWKYYNVLDFRTLEWVANKAGVNTQSQSKTTLHNALEDSIFQTNKVLEYATKLNLKL